MNSQENRIEKIKGLWNEIHGRMVPCYYWNNHPIMRYHYNEDTDTIDCDCGINIELNAPTEEITFEYLIKQIDKLYNKIDGEYLKNKNIDLGIISD